jgi:hypothetical protein
MFLTPFSASGLPFQERPATTSHTTMSARRLDWSIRSPAAKAPDPPGIRRQGVDAWVSSLTTTTATTTQPKEPPHV